MASVRLDPALETTLERLARDRGQTKSDVIRDAIEQLASEEKPSRQSALDRLRPFVGVAGSGGLNLSQDTGRRFREMMQAKRRAGDTG